MVLSAAMPSKNDRVIVREQVPDYSGHEIKRCPPGKAFGADDLTRWSRKRVSGGAGGGAKPTGAIVQRKARLQSDRKS
jgi:hypothetical protein